MPESDVVPSGADAGGVQERGQGTAESLRVPGGTNAGTASEAPGKRVQEQPTGDPAIPEEEQVRRRVQSEVDRRLHQERMRWEQEQAQRQKQDEEARKLQEMDDEEYGAYVRQKELDEQQKQAVRREVLVNLVSGIQSETLALVKDDKRRADLEQRAMAGEFKSYGEFLQVVHQTVLDEALDKERPKLERTVRESTNRERVAEEAESGPQLGSGLPTSRLDRLSSHQKIAAGFAERLRNGNG